MENLSTKNILINSFYEKSNTQSIFLDRLNFEITSSYKLIDYKKVWLFQKGSSNFTKKVWLCINSLKVWLCMTLYDLLYTSYKVIICMEIIDHLPTLQILVRLNRDARAIELSREIRAIELLKTSYGDP